MSLQAVPSSLYSRARFDPFPPILRPATQASSYPFSETNFQDFSRTFQGLRLTFLDSKIHINPFYSQDLNVNSPTVCHTFHIFHLYLTNFQNFSRPAAFFHDFPLLENATIKSQDFPGFTGPLRTLPKANEVLLILQCAQNSPSKYASFPLH